MKKRAIIFDLDNTLYAVDSIGEKLFFDLFKLITSDGRHATQIDNIKKDIMQKPFQTVAAQYQFSNKLAAKCIAHLQQLTFNDKIAPFDDYAHVKKIMADKFLVTTGFKKLQLSKIKSMGIENDFKEIHIVDITIKQQTKKDVFTEIMLKHNFKVKEVLVVGDDVDSEIKAAQQLGIDAILYNKNFNKNMQVSVKTITDFSELNFFYTIS